MIYNIDICKVFMSRCDNDSRDALNRVSMGVCCFFFFFSERGRRERVVGWRRGAVERALQKGLERSLLCDTSGYHTSLGIYYGEYHSHRWGG